MEDADDSESTCQPFTYTIEKVVGNGSFGVVYQAVIAETSETVAIKKVFQDKRYKNRELEIMRELYHPNIVKLKHAFYSKGDKADREYLNVVMEFVPDTIYRILKQYAKAKQQLPLLLSKAYTYQTLRALAYLHDLGICHRDIKPHNLLVDQRTHVVKLCDFGSSKRLVPGEPNVSYICSRYYRAPELIFGATEYTQAIDVWSAGCVAAEMLIGRPIFPGESGVDQLVAIIRVLGTPSASQLLSMNPNHNEFKFPTLRPSGWPKIMAATDGAIEFIDRLLQYSPDTRVAATDALSLEFLAELANSA